MNKIKSTTMNLVIFRIQHLMSRKNRNPYLKVSAAERKYPSKMNSKLINFRTLYVWRPAIINSIARGYYEVDIEITGSGREFWTIVDFRTIRNTRPITNEDGECRDYFVPDTRSHQTKQYDRRYEGLERRY